MTTVALVTGANKGIGFEIARLFGDRGITAIVGARDTSRGTVAADKLGQPFVRLDVNVVPVSPIPGPRAQLMASRTSR